ncbi:stage V sporulation protein R, partial [Peptococcaceae bacterium SCADC1_2_3]
DNIVVNLTNGGYPYLTLENGDYNNQGELYLKHHFEGSELDVFYLENTLPYVYLIWGKPVNLETVVDKRNVLFICSGTKVVKKYL